MAKTLAKQRGTFLTIMLIIQFCGILLATYYLATNQTISNLSPSLITNYKIYSLLDIIVWSVSLLGIFLWKRWSIFLTIGITCLDFFLAFFAWHQITSIWEFLFSYVMVALFFASIYPKWRDFE